MSAPEFTTEEMVRQINALAANADWSARIYGSPESKAHNVEIARLYRAIAARLSDPWSAFAGWQPPPEAERGDGFRCWGYVPGLFAENAAGTVEWVDRPTWVGVEWCDDPDLDTPPCWVADWGGGCAPTAFAPLPPTPKETTDV